MCQKMTPAVMRNDLEKLEKQIEKLRATLTEREGLRNAIQRTLDYYMAPPSKPLSRAHQDINPDDIRDMKLKDAVMYLAERNHGEFHSSTGRDLIVAAGVVKETHSRQVIYQLMTDWSLFEKVRRGVYRLTQVNTEDEEDEAPVRRAGYPKMGLVSEEYVDRVVNK